MSIIYIGKKKVIKEFSFGFSHSNKSILFKKTSNFCLFHVKNNKIIFYSSKPIVGNNNFSKHSNTTFKDFKKSLIASQNNFSACEIKLERDNIYITLASARIGRNRIYFLKNQSEIFISDDIRELFPYSTKKVNRLSIYSTIKFGEKPEILTILNDIKSVPVGSYWEGEVFKLLTNNLTQNDFKVFQKIKYDFTGGDISNTHNLLNQIFSYLSKLDVIIPISGGIDSSLINYMINDHKETHYPAYFMKFGENDGEIEFAKKAVLGTKAELVIYEMKSVDFIDAFHYQTEFARQPIGESSSIALAFYFKQCDIKNYKVIDGALADGCYGSRNYSMENPKYKYKAKYISKLEEIIATIFQLYRLPGGYRFFPRDSFISDSFIRQLNIYTGPLSNTLFKDVKTLNCELEKYFKYYYKMIDPVNENGLDEWMKYSIFKMINYAAKNTTAKTFDNVGFYNEAIYPFMWRSILEDQGHYSWQEKSLNGVIKYPLKKIISKYVDNDFIYRKKVGLNSSFEDWVCTKKNKDFLINIISRRKGMSEVIMGRNNLKKLLRHFASNRKVHPNVSRLVINLAISQAWIERHNLNI